MFRFLFAILLVSHVAFAQPTGGRGDAKALVQTGVRLLDAHDYLGALAAFQGAYAQFPSAKILLNIGTTQKLLDRKADAANSYQRYLDSPDADAARKPEVTQALAELDQAVGKLTITVKPDDAEAHITDEWLPAKTVKLWRVQPGSVTVQARRDGYQPGKRETAVAAGAMQTVAIELAAIPKPEVKPVIITVPSDDLHAHAEEEPRSRFGAFALVHISVAPKMGAAPLLGATADLTPQLAVEAGFLLGPGLFNSSTMYTVAPPPKFGAYLGATFAFLSGQMRPRVSAGMPIFASNGARFSLRGAGGLEYVANRHVSMTLDLGAEVELNPESDIHSVAIVPALGFVGRL